MSRAAILAFVFSLAGFTAAQDDRWNSAETEHYVIHFEKTGTDKKAVARDALYMREMKIKMELLFKQYALAFKFRGKLKKKPVLRLYKDQRSYLTTGAPRMSLAYYRPSTKELVGFQDPKNPDRVFQVLCHEGCHQFFDLVFPKFYANKDKPTWFSEGLADCFGASYFQGRQLFVFSLRGIAAGRTMVIKQYAMRGKTVPLKKFLEMDQRAFMMNAQLNYAQAWSFTHFLWNWPSRASGKGRYKGVVVRLIEGLKEGKSRDEVYKEAFQIGGKPLDLDQLEMEWKDFIKKLPSRGM